MTKSIVRIRQIIKALNDYVKRGNLDFNEEVSLQSVVNETLLIMANEIKNMEIFVENLDNTPVFKGNSIMLSQVVMNLIVNGAHAIKDRQIKESDLKGKIVINSFIEDKNHIILKISDNGCGIKKENLTKIFEPFFTTKEVGKGTGIGLSFVLGRIREHGGTVDVQSELNKGTEFTIKLPLYS